MSTHSEASGAESVPVEQLQAEPKADQRLETIRTWFNFFTLALLGLTLILIVMLFTAEGRSRPEGMTVFLSALLLVLCRVIAVFATALQRIERKLDELASTGRPVR